MAARVCTPCNPTGKFRVTESKVVKPTDLETRLRQHGVSIAIDKKTGEACLVFSESDAEAARSVAEVYKPFERTLTDSQKRELLADLEYYEQLTRRKAV